MRDSVAQCRYMLTRAEMQLSGLNDTHSALSLRPDGKTAGWLLGHLTVTGDFARRLCGRQPMCPSEWRKAFNPGTTPTTDPSLYPPMAELCATFRAVYLDLCDAASVATAAQLMAPNPYEPARDPFPTSGAFLAYILTSHFGYHLGQLSLWREAAGLPRASGLSGLAA